MRISDWSSDVCSSDLTRLRRDGIVVPDAQRTPTHPFRVVIAREGKMVTGVEPAMVGVAQRIEFANVDHWPCPFFHRLSRSIGAGRRLSVEDKIGLWIVSKIDRKSVVSGKSVSVRVDLGCRRNIKKKKKKI